MPNPVERVASLNFNAIRTAMKMKRLPDPRGNVAVGATINAQIPVGETYHQIGAIFTIAGVPATEAQISAQVARIRLTIDGDLKIDLTGAEACMLANLYNTRANLGAIVGGVLPIWLARPWWPEFGSQDGPAWGTADVASFTVEIQMAASAVTIDRVLLRAWTTKPEPLGRHVCIRRLADNQGAAGLKVISDFKPDINKQIMALHVDKAGGTGGSISTFSIKADQMEEWAGEYDFLIPYYRACEIAPQANWTHFIPTLRGRPLDGWPQIAQDFRIELMTTAALTNFNVLIEYAEGVQPGV